MGSHDESKPDDTRTDLGSVSNDNKAVSYTHLRAHET